MKNQELLIIENTPSALTELVDAMPEHRAMIENISEKMPEVIRGTSFFGKQQSQFMDNNLTISHYTPMRNMNQSLAQITKTREAIQENMIKLKRKEIEIEIKERDIEKTDDQLQKKLLAIDIAELQNHLAVSRLYISGAIRELSNYMNQYSAMMETHGLNGWNEETFDQAEEQHHIMKAFEQAYCAAVSGRGGFDEGNMIYITQLGINGHTAQKDLQVYLYEEDQMLKMGKDPTHEMFRRFLHRMAEKHKGCSSEFSKYKGLTGPGGTQLLKIGADQSNSDIPT